MKITLEMEDGTKYSGELGRSVIWDDETFGEYVGNMVKNTIMQHYSGGVIIPELLD